MIVASVAACTPVPLLQEAPVARKGKTIVAVAGAVFLPTQPGTFHEPDGPTVDPGNDLVWIPLPQVLGWVRYGLGMSMELQTAFHLPSFAISVGLKLGILGSDPGDVFGLAVAVDVGASPVLLDVSYGGTLITSFAVSSDLSIDLSGRFGSMVGLWRMPVVTALAGLSAGEHDRLKVGLGYVWAPLGGAAEGAYLGVGWEY